MHEYRTDEEAYAYRNDKKEHIGGGMGGFLEEIVFNAFSAPEKESANHVSYCQNKKSCSEYEFKRMHMFLLVSCEVDHPFNECPYGRHEEQYNGNDDTCIAKDGVKVSLGITYFCEVIPAP